MPLSPTRKKLEIQGKSWKIQENPGKSKENQETDEKVLVIHKQARFLFMPCRRLLTPPGLKPTTTSIPLLLLSWPDDVIQGLFSQMLLLVQNGMVSVLWNTL